MEEEDYLQSEQRVKDLGYMDLNHFLEHKFCVVNGLNKFGGSFAQKLGDCLAVADRSNAIKIMRYWSNECEQHALLYKIYLAKEKSYGTNDSSE